MLHSAGTSFNLVSCRFPLEQASQAFSALLTRESVGKVLLLPNPPASKL